MKALIILADGFEEIEAITPIDLLVRAGIDVVTAGLGKKEICGSHKIKIVVDEILDKSKDNFDAVILPGGPGHLNLMNSNDVLEIVKKFYENKKLCCAICAAPKVFDKAQILENKKYTCFPSMQKEIKSGNYCDDAVVCDGNIITSRSAGTAFDFSFAVIENLLNNNEAKSVKDKIYY
ncbi:MAG: DJ-1/PfpI family protein [Chitinispirillales bacterium]|jgi:4-methyl-5(b-hydroxyethyl)-thiazole monophosphate biosynthesis|nr:DJ-1/PfpI family protein [Chitinispirillales bacterium]